jgi:hypothetical protein
MPESKVRAPRAWLTVSGQNILIRSGRRFSAQCASVPLVESG